MAKRRKLKDASKSSDQERSKKFFLVLLVIFVIFVIGFALLRSQMT